jgi:hypothetical protein
MQIKQKWMHSMQTSLHLADLKKKAAELGLTSAQTGSALAQTKKLGVESAKSHT